MAGSPGGTGSPFFVTSPTPMPRRNVMPGASLQLTLTRISAPCVTSGSSPASLMTLALPSLSVKAQACSSNTTSWPAGRRMATSSPAR